MTAGDAVQTQLNGSIGIPGYLSIIGLKSIWSIRVFFMCLILRCQIPPWYITESLLISAMSMIQLQVNLRLPSQAFITLM